MTKKWDAEKRFVFDCPVCREPALPTQKANEVGDVVGWRLIHPGRITSCFVEDGTDAAETIRTDFNGRFGSAHTDASSQTRTDKIRALTKWSQTYVGRVDSHKIRNIWRAIYGEVPLEVDAWENEGGYCPRTKISTAQFERPTRGVGRRVDWPRADPRSLPVNTFDYDEGY